MSYFAFVLILLSAFLHAGWNFLCKSHHPTPVFILLLNATGFVLTLPCLFLVKGEWLLLPMQFWWLLSVSILAEVLYSLSLGLAYLEGDISLVYPLSRAVPVILTALVTGALGLGKILDPLAVVGLLVLFAGCLVLPQKSFSAIHFRNYLTPALFPVLGAAAGTTCYTIADSLAPGQMLEVFVSPRPVVLGAYFCLVQLGLSLGIVLFLGLRTSEKTRQEWRAAFFSPYPYLAGLFNFAAYFLVLLAMGHVTNVSYVQAFRQISLPLGVFAGGYFLREKLTETKVAGVLLILLGLIFCAL